MKLDTASPADAGWEPEALESALEFAGQRKTNAIVVAVDGAIIGERYFDGWDDHSTRDIASAQKSVTSMLVGIAQEKGLLKIDEPVSTYLGDGWTKATTAQEHAITVRHLITMTSGLTMDFSFEAPPGDVWFYNNNAYHQTPRVLQAVAGKDMQALSTEWIFGPLGMSETSWQPRPNMQDPHGITMNGLYTTGRDAVRFGICVLAGGAPVLGDAAYLKASTTPSQDVNPSYGYLWWLNGQSHAVMPGPNRPVVQGALVPSAPSDMFAALGAFDQKIYVIPSLRATVSRFGGPGGDRPGAAGSDFDRSLWAELSKATP